LVSRTIAEIGELNRHLGLTATIAEQNFNQAIGSPTAVTSSSTAKSWSRPVRWANCEGTTSLSGCILAGCREGPVKGAAFWPLVIRSVGKVKRAR
jgi:hypothetical protein